MKKIIYTLFFLLFSASAFQANSQNIILNPENSMDQKAMHIKSLESKYFEGKVYLHITVSGNTETKIWAVERSLDATNFEAIGFIKINGVTVQNDIAYYFTDELPVIANLYYRLTDYSFHFKPAYSETTSVIPIDENKVNADITTIASITPISNEQKDCLTGFDEQTKSLSGSNEQTNCLTGTAE